LISTNPFGIGLANNGITEARFEGNLDQSKMTEDWTLQVAVHTGFLGAIAYIGLTGAILISLLKTRHYRYKDICPLRVTAGAVFVSMTIAGVMIPVWDHLITSVYAWALIGMALATTRTATNRVSPT
jgi:hypothetical protein